jgi:hypothetical protein
MAGRLFLFILKISFNLRLILLRATALPIRFESTTAKRGVQPELRVQTILNQGQSQASPLKSTVRISRFNRIRLSFPELAFKKSLTVRRRP